METTLNFLELQPRFKTGLVFSVYEGLLPGQQLRLICNQDPNDIKVEFEHANISEFQWQSERKRDDLWEVRIIKSADKKDGCCGMCGGHGE